MLQPLYSNLKPELTGVNVEEDMDMFLKFWYSYTTVHLITRFIKMTEGITSRQISHSNCTVTLFCKYILTLIGPMKFSMKLHTIQSGWSIVYIEGSQFTILKNIVFLSLKILS